MSTGEATIGCRWMVRSVGERREHGAWRPTARNRPVAADMVACWVGGVVQRGDGSGVKWGCESLRCTSIGYLQDWRVLA